MSSRQRRPGAASKRNTANTCSCSGSAVDDPDHDKYHRRHYRITFFKNLLMQRKPFLMVQMGMILVGAMILSQCVPIFLSKSMSMISGEWLTKQYQRHLRQPSSFFVVPPSSQYHQINMEYPGIKSLTNSALPPHAYTIENFLTVEECNFLIDNTQDCLRPSSLAGSGKVGTNSSRVYSSSRTSWTCRLQKDDLPNLMGKVMKLTNKPLEHMEYPQLARYESTQQFLSHYDAFNENSESQREKLKDGGNRLVTILIYLNDVKEGGGTMFHFLNMEVRPRRGMAVVFFPSTVDGKMDKLAMHAALPAVDVKYVSQMWIRQHDYVGDGLTGGPEKRILVKEPTDQTTTSFWSWL